MGKRIGCLGLCGLLAALLLVGTYWGIPAGFRMLGLIQNTLEQPALEGTISLYRSEGNCIDGAFLLYNPGDTPILRLQTDTFSVYWQKDRICLDNGRVYDISEFLNALPLPKPEALALLPLAGIQTSTTDGKTDYTLNLRLTDLPVSDLTFTETDGRLSAISLLLREGYRIELEFRDAVDAQIPTQILMALGGTGTPASQLLPLVRSLIRLSENPLPEMEYEAEVRFASFPVRFSGGFAVQPSEILISREKDSHTWNLPMEMDPQKLSFGLGWLFLREANITPLQEGSADYEITLAPDHMEPIITRWIPELAGAGLSVSKGNLMLCVRENSAESLGLSCSAGMPFMDTVLPVSVMLTLRIPA